VIPSLTERSRASGWGRRVSLKRRTSVEWLASRKISVGFRLGAARSFLKTRGNCDRKSFSRTSTTIATLSSELASRAASSAIVGISSVGRLSMQK